MVIYLWSLLLNILFSFNKLRNIFLKQRSRQGHLIPNTLGNMECLVYPAQLMEHH